jgi:glycosyltransferase involved in cell wall biosynthesis
MSGWTALSRLPVSRGGRARRDSSPWAGPGAVVDWPAAGDEMPAAPVTIVGWALFPDSPTSRVEAWLDDLPLGRARLGLPRRDVRDASLNPLGLASGFSLTTNLSRHPAGEARLRIVATGAGGERLELPDLPVTITAPEVSDKRASLPPFPTPVAAARSGPRTLVATHELTLGGAQLYLVELLRELLALGAIEPTVVSAADGPVRGQLEGLGIPVHVCGPTPIDDIASYAGRAEELLAWAEGRDFELALVNTSMINALGGAEVAASLEIPAVWLVHESFEPEVLWAHLDDEVRSRAEGRLSQAAAAIFEAEATRRLYEPLIGAERTHAMPYALDRGQVEVERASLDRASLRARAGIAEDADVALCLGTVEPRKAQVLLAQAFDLVASRHPRAELLVVGCRDDDYARLLEELVAELDCGDRVTLVPVTRDVHRWFAVSDLLVCASDIESLPRTVLEAMAWRKPVLATGVFGLPEVIADGETGWLCEHSDLDSLAGGLDRAFGSGRDERRRIAEAAAARLAADHDPRDYARRVAALLAEVSGGAAAPTAARARG